MASVAASPMRVKRLHDAYIGAKKERGVAASVVSTASHEYVRCLLAAAARDMRAWRAPQGQMTPEAKQVLDNVTQWLADAESVTDKAQGNFLEGSYGQTVREQLRAETFLWKAHLADASGRGELQVLHMVEAAYLEGDPTVETNLELAMLMVRIGRCDSAVLTAENIVSSLCAKRPAASLARNERILLASAAFILGVAQRHSYMPTRKAAAAETLEMALRHASDVDPMSELCSRIRQVIRAGSEVAATARTSAAEIYFAPPHGGWSADSSALLQLASMPAHMSPPPPTRTLRDVTSAGAGADDGGDEPLFTRCPAPPAGVKPAGAPPRRQSSKHNTLVGGTLAGGLGQLNATVPAGEGARGNVGAAPAVAEAFSPNQTWPQAKSAAGGGAAAGVPPPGAIAQGFPAVASRRSKRYGPFSGLDFGDEEVMEGGGRVVAKLVLFPPDVPEEPQVAAVGHKPPKPKPLPRALDLRVGYLTLGSHGIVREYLGSSRHLPAWTDFNRLLPVHCMIACDAAGSIYLAPMRKQSDVKRNGEPIAWTLLKEIYPIYINDTLQLGRDPAVELVIKDAGYRATPAAEPLAAPVRPPRISSAGRVIKTPYRYKPEKEWTELGSGNIRTYLDHLKKELEYEERQLAESPRPSPTKAEVAPMIPPTPEIEDMPTAGGGGDDVAVMSFKADDLEELENQSLHSEGEAEREEAPPAATKQDSRNTARSSGDTLAVPQQKAKSSIRSNGPVTRKHSGAARSSVGFMIEGEEAVEGEDDPPPPSTHHRESTHIEAALRSVDDPGQVPLLCYLASIAHDDDVDTPVYPSLCAALAVLRDDTQDLPPPEDDGWSYLQGLLDTSREMFDERADAGRSPPADDADARASHVPSDRAARGSVAATGDLRALDLCADVMFAAEGDASSWLDGVLDIARSPKAVKPPHEAWKDTTAAAPAATNDGDNGGGVAVLGNLSLLVDAYAGDSLDARPQYLDGVIDIGMTTPRGGKGGGATAAPVQQQQQQQQPTPPPHRPLLSALGAAVELLEAEPLRNTGYLEGMLDVGREMGGPRASRQPAPTSHLGASRPAALDDAAYAEVLHMYNALQACRDALPDGGAGCGVRGGYLEGVMDVGISTPRKIRSPKAQSAPVNLAPALDVATPTPTQPQAHPQPSSSLAALYAVQDALHDADNRDWSYLAGIADAGEQLREQRAAPPQPTPLVPEFHNVDASKVFPALSAVTRVLSAGGIPSSYVDGVVDIGVAGWAARPACGVPQSTLMTTTSGRSCSTVGFKDHIEQRPSLALSVVAEVLRDEGMCAEVIELFADACCTRQEPPVSPARSGRSTPALCALRSCLADDKGATDKERTCLDGLIETADSEGQLGASGRRTPGFTSNFEEAPDLCGACAALDAVLMAGEDAGQGTYLEGFVGVAKELHQQRAGGQKRRSRGSRVTLVDEGPDPPTRRSSRKNLKNAKRASDGDAVDGAVSPPMVSSPQAKPHPMTLPFTCGRLGVVADLFAADRPRACMNHLREMLAARDEVAQEAAAGGGGGIVLGGGDEGAPTDGGARLGTPLPYCVTTHPSKSLAPLLKSCADPTLYPALSILGTCALHMSAGTIQRAWRCRQAREERRRRAAADRTQRVDHEEREEAASIIQFHWRLALRRRQAKRELSMRRHVRRVCEEAVAELEAEGAA